MSWFDMLFNIFSFFYSPAFVLIVLFAAMIFSIYASASLFESAGIWGMIPLLLAIIFLVMFITTLAYIAVNGIGPWNWNWEVIT